MTNVPGLLAGFSEDGADAQQQAAVFSSTSNDDLIYLLCGLRTPAARNVDRVKLKLSTHTLSLSFVVAAYETRGRCCCINKVCQYDDDDH